MNWDKALNEDEIAAARDYSGEGPPPDEESGVRETLRKAGALPLNDFGNGQRVVIYHGDDLMFVPRMGWFAWDGHRWAQDFDGMAVRRRAHRISHFIKREAFELGYDPEEAGIVQAAEESRTFLNRLRVKKDPTEDDKVELRRLIELHDAAADIRKRLADKRAKHLRHAKSAGNTGPITNMLKEAEPYRERTLADLNRAPMVINTAEVTLELVEATAEDDLDAWSAEEGPRRVYAVTTREQVREDLITKSMPVVYDPAATCPTFDRFLADIQPDPAMRAFLQRWFGYTLTGLTSEQKLVFFHGTGRNGKSTLVDLIARMMGEYATSLPIETLTGTEQRKGSDATPDLVRVPGARMVRASEPEEGLRFKEAIIKLLTGGEPILIRKMREEFVEIEPVFKLTISGNHKPNVRGTDDGIWRRILLVPFDQQIPKDAVDPLLPQKLWEERSGVLNWLLAGTLDFLAGGLREPEGVLQATEQFRDDSDPVRTFLLDACKITGDAADFVLSRDLVEAFQVYQRDQGGQPWGNRSIQLRLSEKANVFRVDGATFTPRKSATANGYGGLRLTDAMAARLSEWRGREGQGGKRGGDPAPLPPDARDLV
jgi:putative DNA primase/helicase